MYIDRDGYFALPLIFATPFLEVILGAIAAAAPYILVAVAVVLVIYIAIEVVELIEDNTKTDDDLTEEPPSLDYPGNDPNKSPGEGFEWRGKGDPASGNGSWYNRETGEHYYPDPNHGEPIGPHWDYWKDGSPRGWRIFPDGNVLPK